MQSKKYEIPDLYILGDGSPDSYMNHLIPIYEYPDVSPHKFRQTYKKKEQWSSQLLNNEDKKKLFDQTITGFILHLFNMHSFVPLAETYICEHIRANRQHLRRPDGSIYQGNMKKIVKGSLTSNGVFIPYQCGKWLVNWQAAQEFESRTISKMSNSLRRTKERIPPPNEISSDKHQHVYNLLSGFLESHKCQQLRDILQEVQEIGLIKYREQYETDQIRQGIKECTNFFQEVLNNNQ